MKKLLTFTFLFALLAAGSASAGGFKVLDSRVVSSVAYAGGGETKIERIMVKPTQMIQVPVSRAVEQPAAARAETQKPYKIH